MYHKLVSVLYALNVVFSALFALATPPALMTLFAWLLSSRAGVGEWIYALMIFFGVIIGFVSMIRFLLRATDALARIEKSRQKSGPEQSSGRKETPDRRE